MVIIHWGLEFPAGPVARGLEVLAQLLRIAIAARSAAAAGTARLLAGHLVFAGATDERVGAGLGGLGVVGKFIIGDGGIVGLLTGLVAGLAGRRVGLGRRLLGLAFSDDNEIVDVVEVAAEKDGESTEDEGKERSEHRHGTLSSKWTYSGEMPFHGRKPPYKIKKYKTICDHENFLN